MYIINLKNESLLLSLLLAASTLDSLELFLLLSHEASQYTDLVIFMLSEIESMLGGKLDLQQIVI